VIVEVDGDHCPVTTFWPDAALPAAAEADELYRRTSAALSARGILDGDARVTVREARATPGSWAAGALDRRRTCNQRSCCPGAVRTKAGWGALPVRSPGPGIDQSEAGLYRRG
jgi:hypothetical protein